MSRQWAELRNALEELANAARLVHAEVQARLGDVRSKLGLFQRFKTRCEWYDRERLTKLADEAKGSAENRLTAELALFLFDQGLNPLIRPRVANQEPDILDPSLQGRVYVEAKQYKESKGTREDVRTGARQIWAMLATLRGTKYEVQEAFFPIFRRGGPRYVLPRSPLRHGGAVMYPLLIDLAPSKESGSQLRENEIEIPPEELLPLPPEARGQAGAGEPSTFNRDARTLEVECGSDDR
jgi:hypothetical protein